MTTKDAVLVLVKALKEDEGYYDGWVGNIAISFKDAFSECDKTYKNRKDVHKIANIAAVEFLKKLGA